jgi:molybdate transport system substrate-binding protein
VTLSKASVLLIAASAATAVATASAGTPARAAEVSVAVASNFAAPMQKIAEAFERDTGHKAVLAFGSTGKFHAQVRKGAPFHVLLAADDKTAERLEREGFAVPGTRFIYAVGRLALWSRIPGRVDDQGDVLRTGGFAHLALANPKLAPYGAAAVEVLTGLGLAAALAPRFVQGENIAQTHQFVASGNAELGFVATSQVFFEGRLVSGSAWVVPASLHAPIRQQAVLLQAGQDNSAATALLAYLRGDTARALIRASGYDL